MVAAEEPIFNSEYSVGPHGHQWTPIYGYLPDESAEEVEVFKMSINYNNTSYICSSCKMNMTEAGLDEEGIQNHLETHEKEGIIAGALPVVHRSVDSTTEMAPPMHRVCIGQRCTVCNEKQYTEEYLESISDD